MTTKILASVLCTSTVLLSACGGGSDSNTDYRGAEKLDFNKVEDIELISHPAVQLSNNSFKINPVLSAASLAQDIYDYVDDTRFNVSCTSGTVTQNNDKTVTLKECENFTATLKGQTSERLNNKKISATIKLESTGTRTAYTDKLTLTNMSVDMSDYMLSYNGVISATNTSGASTRYAEVYEANNFSYKVVDKRNNQTNQYTLNNYKLSSNYSLSAQNGDPENIDDTAHGQLVADLNGKSFNINFNAILGFSTQQDLDNLQPHTATIGIRDNNNDRNEIRIARSSNDQALVSAFANGTSVVGYPKTVNWSSFK